MTQYKVVESLENLPNPTKHLCWSRLFDNITLNISTFYLYLHVNQESGLRNIPVTELYECVFVMEWWLMAGMLPPPPIRAFQAQVWTARQLWPVQDNQPGSQSLAENTSPPTDSLPWCWRWQPSSFCQVWLRLRCKLLQQPPVTSTSRWGAASVVRVERLAGISWPWRARPALPGLRATVRNRKLAGESKVSRWLSGRSHSTNTETFAFCLSDASNSLSEKEREKLSNVS